MRNFLRIALGLVALQALLIGLYRGMQKPRGDAGPLRYERIDRTVPSLVYRTRDGRQHNLTRLQGPLLIHFWATWCPPCVEELPGLLRLGKDGPVPVLAISVDPDWAVIETFLGRSATPDLALADGSASADALGFGTLPQTFFLDASGRLRLHFPGARDWSTPALRQLLDQPLGKAPP